MRKETPVYRPKEFETLCKDLGTVIDQKTGKSIFNRLADVLAFAAYLGFQLEFKRDFTQDKRGEDIQWQIIRNQDDDVIIFIMNIAENGNITFLEKNCDIDPRDLFHDYAYGGLTKISQWCEDNPGDLLDAILQGLSSENIIDLNNNDDDQALEDLKF